MAMVPYVVVQGDYLTRIGYLRGFSPAEVWNDPKNADLKARRKSMDILLPGDVVFVPDTPRPPLPLELGATNDFVGAIPTITIHVVLQVLGKPLASEPFEVRGLPEPVTGTADGEGKVSVDVPANVGRVSIFLPKRNETYPISIGHLDPADDRAGVRKRLANLGYLGRHDTTDPDAWRRALAAFQEEQGLSPTGELDTATGEKLAKVHGS